MNMPKRILLTALLIMLGIAMIPLWGRAALMPCLYVGRYAVSYSWPGGRVVMPENGFRSFPPLCLQVPRSPGSIS
jgi:hypothetical protein